MNHKFTASATTRDSSEANIAGNARKRIMPVSDNKRKAKLQIVQAKDTNPLPTPTPPAGAVWVPRGDRHAIVEAFSNGVSIYKLCQRQRRPFKIVESVLRERLDELEGRIRVLESDRFELVKRRFAA